MFTGLVAEIGEVSETAGSAAGTSLRISCQLPALVLGESIAVDGCCLTVARLAEGGFWCDASPETLATTTLGGWAIGRRVHLERALLPTDRLGGHIVSGHVDGVGRIVARRPLGDSLEMTFEVPDRLAGHVVQKGSIALDGTSLTVNDVDGARLRVALIPHTIVHTTFATRPDGDPVNVETDVLAKYVERLLNLQPKSRFP